MINTGKTNKHTYNLPTSQEGNMCVYICICTSLSLSLSFCLSLSISLFYPIFLNLTWPKISSLSASPPLSPRRLLAPVNMLWAMCSDELTVCEECVESGELSLAFHSPLLPPSHSLPPLLHIIVTASKWLHHIAQKIHTYTKKLILNCLIWASAQECKEVSSFIRLKNETRNSPRLLCFLPLLSSILA